MPRCPLRGLVWSAFTIRSSTRVHVVTTPSVSSLARASLFWEMNFSSVQITSFTDPLFRHLSSSIAFSICAQLTNVRPTRSSLAISSLLIPLITASPSAPRIWLGKSIPLAHEADLSQPYSLTQAACCWPQSSGCIVYSLQYCAVTPCTRLHSFEAHALMCVLRSCLGPGLHDLGIRKLIPLTLFRPRLVPQHFSRVIARNVSPFEKSGVHRYISETAVILYVLERESSFNKYLNKYNIDRYRTRRPKEFT
jgi:hypothetical protein